MEDKSKAAVGHHAGCGRLTVPYDPQPHPADAILVEQAISCSAVYGHLFIWEIVL